MRDAGRFIKGLVNRFSRLVGLVPDTPVDDECEMRVTLRAVGADNFVVVVGVGRRSGRCWEARNFSVRAYCRTYTR